MLATLLSVALLHWVILLTPGANVLVVSQLAASGRRRAACFAGLGITAVAVIWASLAALGVHAIFEAHPYLRLTLQVAGGLYLCHVAVRVWRSEVRQDAEGIGDLSAPAAFRLGFLTNILNPKSALFFGGVFATALPAQAPADLLLAVVAVVFVNALAWHVFLAIAFSHAGVQSAYARSRRAFNRFAATMIGLFGVRILLSTLAEARLRLGGGAA